MGCMPRTVRLDRELEDKVGAYCRKNDVSLNRLVNMAVEKFISERQVIEMVPLTSEDLKDGRKGGRDEKDESGK